MDFFKFAPHPWSRDKIKCKLKFIESSTYNVDPPLSNTFLLDATKRSINYNQMPGSEIKLLFGNHIFWLIPIYKFIAKMFSIILISINMKLSVARGVNRFWIWESCYKSDWGDLLFFILKPCRSIVTSKALCFDFLARLFQSLLTCPSCQLHLWGGLIFVEKEYCTISENKT